MLRWKQKYGVTGLGGGTFTLPAGMYVAAVGGGLNATPLRQSLQGTNIPRRREENNAPTKCLSRAENRGDDCGPPPPDVVFSLGSLRIAAVSNLRAPIKPPG